MLKFRPSQIIGLVPGYDIFHYLLTAANLFLIAGKIYSSYANTHILRT